MFYYAGHGIQTTDGDNHLIPLEAKISREFEAKTEAINADLVLNAMFDAKTKINIVILDACRDNAFANSKKGGKRGLANIARENTFIAYATQPNKTADDGVFMEYFSKWITQPLPIGQILDRVRDDVIKATSGEQSPNYANLLEKDFYFNYQPNQSTVLAPPMLASVPNGQGSLILEDGETYFGDIKDGKPNGQGTLVNKENVISVGTFVNGKLNGQGKVTDNEGNTVAGNFVDGKANGQMIITKLTGEKIVVTAKNDKPDGQITMIGSDDKEYLRATVKDGQFIHDESVIMAKKGGDSITIDANKRATVTTSKGDVINGIYKNNKFELDGQITHTLPDGTKITGKFENGSFVGQVTMVFPNGDKVVGAVNENGNLEGQVAILHKDGKKSGAIFKNGKPTSLVY